MAELHRGIGLIERLAVVANGNGTATIGRVAIWLGIGFLLVCILGSCATSCVAIWIAAQHNQALLSNRQSHVSLEQSMRSGDEALRSAIDKIESDRFRGSRWESEKGKIDTQFRGVTSTVETLRQTQADILERLRKLETTK